MRGGHISFVLHGSPISKGSLARGGDCLCYGHLYARMRHMRIASCAMFGNSAGKAGKAGTTKRAPKAHHVTARQSKTSMYSGLPRLQCIISNFYATKSLYPLENVVPFSRIQGHIPRNFLVVSPIPSKETTSSLSIPSPHKRHSLHTYVQNLLSVPVERSSYPSFSMLPSDVALKASSR
jgi:hypothetical protein